ncbi:metallophosphoesterase family protein [Planctomycetota bacterium]|nr:metallophosphoesterase family protein [Planctomycetota bacterium]
MSDTHMGRPKSAVWGPKALQPLWNRMDATDLIINGDVAELHDPRYRALAARQVLELQELCQQDGVKLTMLSGNHDPHLTDMRHLSLYKGEVFLTHGDIIHPAISPWNDYAVHLQELHEHAKACLADDEQSSIESQMLAAQHASHLKWNEFAADEKPKSRIAQFESTIGSAMKVLWYWNSIPKMAANFAAKHVPKSRFFIFGHIHHSGIWENNGRVVINTGSFDFPKRPRVVVIKRDQLSVWKLKRNDMTYGFDSTSLAKWDLNNVQVSPFGNTLHAA